MNKVSEFMVQLHKEILEKRKDYKGALEAYTQSLKVEWNQPPIIEAKSRLEKLVGQ